MQPAALIYNLAGRTHACLEYPRTKKCEGFPETFLLLVCTLQREVLLAQMEQEEAAAPAPLRLGRRVTPVRSELRQHLGTDSGVNRRKIN